MRPLCLIPVAVVLLCGAVVSHQATVRAVDPCRSLSTNCTYCLTDPQCGWCSTTQVCVPGTWAGPTTGACPQWSFESCAAPPPAPSPTSPAPIPGPIPELVGVNIGSFWNFCNDMVYLSYQSMGSVCATSPPVPSVNSLMWYTGQIPGGQAHAIDISSCTAGVSAITVISSTSGVTYGTWIVGSNAEATNITIVDFAYGTTSNSLVGSNLVGPNVAEMTMNVTNNLAAPGIFAAGNGALDAAATWYTIANASINATLYYNGAACTSTIMQSGSANSLFPWTVGWSATCAGIDRATLVTAGSVIDSNACTIHWQKPYGWSGNSMLILSDAASPTGWCILPNLVTTNGTQASPAGIANCPVCPFKHAAMPSR